MAEWPDSFVHANGIDIHYYRTGNGSQPPLLLLHGVMDDGLGWIPVARDLQDTFDVLMLDARGHGQTRGPLEDFSYSLLSEDVIALMDALQLQRPILFGHSMGAMTAAVLAAKHADLVRALVLEDPPFRDQVEPSLQSAQPTPEQLQMLQGILSLRSLSPQQRLEVARAVNPLWAEIELAPWVESKLAFQPELFHYLQMTPAWRESLKQIACPLLLVTGDPAAHAIVTPQQAEEVRQLCPQAEVVQIAGAGHCVHRDRYGETMPQIQAFLKRV